jgi:F-type H+-transporting ATPase subunit epsilon
MADNSTNIDSSKFFDLEIYTPSDVFLSCKVRSVTVPSVNGTFQVLINHAPIVAAVDAGTTTYIDEKLETHLLYVENGMVEIKNNKAVFTMASAEKIEDIEISVLEQLVNEANIALMHTDLKDVSRITTNRKVELMKQKLKAVQLLLSD